MGVDSLDEDRRKMLQLERESGLDPDDERRRSRAISRHRTSSPRRPLHFDRLRYRGEPLAGNVVPIQNKTGLAKTLPRHNRINRGLHEFREWPGPREIARAAFPHLPTLPYFAQPRQPALCSGRARAKQSGGAPLQFVRQNILLAGRDPPAMPKRVLEFAAAIAIELIFDRPENLQARDNRGGRERIDILDIEMDHDRGPADRLRAQGIMVRKFIAQHDFSLADCELRMADLALMRDAKHLHRAEGIFVECDGFAGVADAEIGYGAFVPLGDRLDSRAHLSSLLFCRLFMCKVKEQ